MKHRPRTYLLVGGANVSSIFWTVVLFFIGAALMLGILILLSYIGALRGGL